jgi:hypothetical protein
VLGEGLPHDVLVEELVDLRRLGQLVELDLTGLREFLLDDLVAEIDALVADVDAGARNELTCLALPAKEHFSRSPPSPMRAMSADPSPIRHTRPVPVVMVPAEHRRGAENCSESATCR